MKKWLLLSAAALFLAACNNGEATPTIELEENINTDVQSLVDQTTDDKFASLIYSEQGTSYLLLNATGTTETLLEEKDDNLHIYVTETDDSSPDIIDDVVYKFELEKKYDMIHLYLNGQEIAFEVWYG